MNKNVSAKDILGLFNAKTFSVTINMIFIFHNHEFHEIVSTLIAQLPIIKNSHSLIIFPWPLIGWLSTKRSHVSDVSFVHGGAIQIIHWYSQWQCRSHPLDIKNRFLNHIFNFRISKVFIRKNMDLSELKSEIEAVGIDEGKKKKNLKQAWQASAN